MLSSSRHYLRARYSGWVSVSLAGIIRGAGSDLAALWRAGGDDTSSPAAFGDEDGLLGSDFLSLFRITIDEPHRKLYLTPVEDEAGPRPSPQTPGVDAREPSWYDPWAEAGPPFGGPHRTPYGVSVAQREPTVGSNGVGCFGVATFFLPPPRRPRS